MKIRSTCLGQRFGPHFLHTIPVLFANSSVITWDVFTLLHEKVKTSHVKTLLFAKSAGRVCKKWGPKRCPKQVDRFFNRKVDIFEGVCQATFWSLFAIVSLLNRFPTWFSRKIVYLRFEIAVQNGRCYYSWILSLMSLKWVRGSRESTYLPRPSGYDAR